MKTWTIIQNTKQYEEVMDRIDELSTNPPSPESDEGKELYLLGYLADKYESEKFPVLYPDPIQAIRVRMEELNLTIADLMDAFGDRGTASKVLNRKRNLSLTMIRSLSEKLTLPASLLIMPVRLSSGRPGKSIRKAKRLPDSAKSKRGLARKRSS